MNKKVNVVGSINYDFFLQVKKQPQIGETLHAQAVRFSCGGKGANQAYQLGSLGVDTTMFGCIGNDTYGEMSKKDLLSVGVHVDSIESVDATTGLGFVTVFGDGEVTAIIEKGANSFVTMDYIQRFQQKIFQCDILVLQNEIPMDVVEYLLKEASKRTITTVYNPAPALDFDEEIYRCIDYLVLNEVEAAHYLKVSSKNEVILENITKLTNKINKGVVLTLGSKGSYYSNNEMTYIPIVETTALDSTGAGDSYVGAFVYGLSKGLDEISSCKLGAEASSKTVESFGRGSVPRKLNR